MSWATYNRNKDTVWRVLGNKCARCGCTDQQLQIDHIDVTTKEYDILPKLGGKLGPLWEEIHKCQLLCEDCHKEKTKEDHEAIQRKRKEFIHYKSYFDPILQEHRLDISIDVHKRDGKAYIKLIQHIAKELDMEFWDVILEFDRQHSMWFKYNVLKDWDTINWDETDLTEDEMREYKEKSTKELKKIEEENPTFFKYIEDKYINHKDVSIPNHKSGVMGKRPGNISFTKMIDEIIKFGDPKRIMNMEP